jgi:hypothetical protein
MAGQGDASIEEYFTFFEKNGFGDGYLCFQSPQRQSDCTATCHPLVGRRCRAAESLSSLSCRFSLQHSNACHVPRCSPRSTSTRTCKSLSTANYTKRGKKRPTEFCGQHLACVAPCLSRRSLGEARHVPRGRSSSIWRASRLIFLCCVLLLIPTTILNRFCRQLEKTRNAPFNFGYSRFLVASNQIKRAAGRLCEPQARAPLRWSSLCNTFCTNMLQINKRQ